MSAHGNEFRKAQKIKPTKAYKVITVRNAVIHKTLAIYLQSVSFLLKHTKPFVAIKTKLTAVLRNATTYQHFL